MPVKTLLAVAMKKVEDVWWRIDVFDGKTVRTYRFIREALHTMLRKFLG